MIYLYLSTELSLQFKGRASFEIFLKISLHFTFPKKSKKLCKLALKKKG